jgi:hypothetical protein
MPITLTEIKLMILGLLIITSTWYVYHLKSEIQTQATTIATLRGNIATGNQAVIDAGLATKELQNKLDAVVVNQNKPIIIASEKIKTVIVNRPVSTTCIDAVMNLENTAKGVTTDWNSR